MITVLESARIFDGNSAELLEGSVIVEGDRIVEVATGAYSGRADRRVPCAGRFLMPGLIDAHFHAYTPSFDIFGDDQLPHSLVSAYACRILEDTLQRGFTSVRDAAGGDIGLRMAIERGLIRGPRFFFAGKALSQTGGHGDFREPSRRELCDCHGYSGNLSVTVDGPDEVRKAAREELRKGATQLKIFVSGGGASPSDPIWMRQFTDEEIRAAVEEADTRRTYVMAHSHTDEASRRCAELGVRTIEHGTMIENDSTAQLIAARKAFIVPTLSVVEVQLRHASELRHLVSQPEKLEFIKSVYQIMLASIERCRRAGVRLGLGADLLGMQFHPFQGGELELRGEAEQSIDVLRSATSINAEILQQSGRLGCIKAGAFADLLVVEGDPLKALGLFREPFKNLPVVMKAGDFIRNNLN